MFFRVSWRRALLGALVTGLLFALAGFGISLQTVSAQMLPYVLAPGPGLQFRELVDGLPVPRLLDWDLTRIEWSLTLGEMSPALLALLGLLLGVVLWLLAVSVLNPTFHPLRLAASDGDGSADSEVDGGEDAEPAEPLLPEQEAPADPALPAQAEESSPLSEVRALPATADAPEQAAAPSTTYAAPAILFESASLVKAVRLLPAVGLPLGAVWILAGLLGPGAWATTWLLRLAAVGIALWTGYRYEGLAGSFRRPSLHLWRDALPALILGGAAYGLMLFVLMRWVFPAPLPPVLLRYQMLGTFHCAYWNAIARSYLFSACAVWFAAGTLLVVLGRPGLTGGQRVALAVLPLAAAIAAWTVERPYTPEALARRFDITPAVIASIPVPYERRRPATGVPDGPQAGQELARRAGLTPPPVGPRVNRSVLFFSLFPRFAPYTILRQQPYTEDGLTTDPDSAARVMAYLQKHDFQTALSWVAIKHLYNIGTVHFDASAAIFACLLDLMRCPHAAQCNGTLRNMLFTCAASPQNLALLDQYADQRNFAHPDRVSQRMMGDLYVRFGQVGKALAWYRRAEMPHSFLARIQKERPMFHQGTVHGILTLNGKPLSGAQVGVLPRRLNGLPLDLEPFVLHAPEEFLQRRPYPGFPQLHPRPWVFRWIAAGTLTDANGAFSLADLTEGQYILVCALPPGIHLMLPQDAALTVQNPPPAFTLNYANPSADLGAIALSVSGSSIQR